MNWLRYVLFDLQDYKKFLFLRNGLTLFIIFFGSRKVYISADVVVVIVL